MEQKMPKKSRKQAKRKKKSIPKIQYYYFFKRDHVFFCRSGTKTEKRKKIDISKSFKISLKTQWLEKNYG